MTGRRGVTVALLLLALTTTACTKIESGTPAAGETPESAPPATGSPQVATSADGVHIQYRVYGRGDPAVVLVHCWSCDSSYWSQQVEALKPHYTVVTVDLAGHGGSGRNRTDWSMGNYGEDVAAVVRRISNSKVVLVGHSMGGPVVLEAAQRIGDRVIGIIAVDALKSVGQPPISERELELRMAPFRADFIGQTRKFVTEWLFRPDADPLLVRKVADDMALAPPEVAIPSMEAVARMDLNDVISRVHVPIVAINADLGMDTDEARIRRYAPNFRAVVLEHTGHFLMMEDPERFNPILLREIAALENGAHG